MSTLTISVKALASVRETMKASLYWRTDFDNTPLCFFHSFMGNNASVFTTSEKTVAEKADDFVRQAFIYNAEEYHRGKYAEMNADPIEYGDFLRAVKDYKAERLDVFQLLKTLRMISYNTMPEGWMKNSIYENWSYRKDYEEFHKTLNRMISNLANSIVDRLPQMENAKWCLE